MITIALDAAVRAVIAVEFLRDLAEADLVDVDQVMLGIMPEDVLRHHAAARVGGKAVRGLGQFLAEVEADVLPPIQDMRAQLRRVGVLDIEFDGAVRALLRGSAQ